MGEPQGYNRKEFVHRVGTFFLLVAIGLLILFLLSEQAGGTNFEYFCWSTILFVLGFIFRSQYRKPASPASGRFGIFKRLKPKSKEENKE
jgi:hypothetical protein